MKRLGSKKNWDFEDIRSFKRKAGGTMGSRKARREAKIIARAEKRSERQRAIQEFFY
jgi:hypothetical protein